MNSLTITTNNLIKAINNSIPKGGFLTLEVGVSSEGMKTVTATIMSGSYSHKIVYFSITGVITKGYHDITQYNKRENISEDAMTAFRELMFSVNSILDSQQLRSAIYKNNIYAFNAIIKPWSVEISHISGVEIIRAARLKDCENILISGTDGRDHGSFKLGEAKNAIQGAYELLTDNLSLFETKQHLSHTIELFEAEMSY